MARLLFILLFFSQAQAQGFLGLQNKIYLNQRLGTGAQYITGSLTFDAQSAYECTILREGNDSVKIFYSGGNSSNQSAVGLITTDTIGGTYSKQGVVVGNGVVTSRYANCSDVVKSGGVYYLYAVAGYGNTSSQSTGKCYLYTSTDGRTFTDQGVILDYSLMPNGTAYGNIGIVKDTAGNPVQIGGKYKMVTEGNSTNFLWELHIFEATSLAGPWTWVRKATGLQVGVGSYSGACIKYLDGVYHIFYHYSETGVVPTYLAYATSTDLTTFTKWEVPFKRLESKPYGTIAPPSFITGTSQLADCYIEQYRGKTYMVAEYTKNSTPTQNVTYLWVYNGTFKELITDLYSCIECRATYP